MAINRFDLSSMDNIVEAVSRELLTVQNNIILQQLNDMIKEGILIIESTQPVLVQMAQTYEVEVRQAIRLTFRGAEEFQNLKDENQQLKEQLQSVKSILRGTND